MKDESRQHIAAETGSPLGICGAAGPQCDVPIGFIDYTLETLPKFQWSRDIGIAQFASIRSRRLVEKEAVGVVACITPWNVPLQINLAKCIPALAAGCAVVLKAAPDTPWSATMLGRLVKEHTDIPAGVFNVITAGDPRTVTVRHNPAAERLTNRASASRPTPHRGAPAEVDSAVWPRATRRPSYGAGRR